MGRGVLIISEIEMVLWKKHSSTRKSIVTRLHCSAVAVQNYTFFLKNLVLQAYTKEQWKLVSETLTGVLCSWNDN